ncbi:MAG: hypothetical protein KBC45_08700 [Pseudomonas sp.]|uniref:hypothetical protein n=1 Tax=Pseudomonas sp. TaxID=306 RepID=UPI001B745CAB|nr:hypothetical protein [Pseudomonas sp.]MBP6954487.1 hypothetical protein [Pseudomonas sp.]
MSLIKKAAALTVLLSLSAGAAYMWDAHAAFDKTGEALVRQLGVKILKTLGSASQTCRGHAMIDSVKVESRFPLSNVGSAVLYMSGKNNNAMSIRYVVESSDGKVYVRPYDIGEAQSAVLQFGMSGCS